MRLQPFSSWLKRELSILQFIAFLYAGQGAPPADAAGYVVNTLDDNIANDGASTLHEAILVANITPVPVYEDCGSGSSGNETITLDAGDYRTCAALPLNNQPQNGVAHPQDGNGIGGADCDIGAYEAPTPFLIFLPLTVK